MKKLFIIVAFVALAMPTLVSCRETTEKTVIIEKEGEEKKGILERAGEKADKEVNKEIDNTIDNMDNEE